MKKLTKKLLKRSKKLYKKHADTVKTVARNWKRNRATYKLYIEGVTQGALALGPAKSQNPQLVGATPEDNVKGAIVSFDRFLSGKEDGHKYSQAMSLKLALHKTAEKIGNADQYDHAYEVAIAAMRRSKRQPKTPVDKPVNPVWKWLIFAVAVLLVLGLVALFSHGDKKTININDDQAPIVSQTPTCSTWTMKAMPTNPKDNKWFEDGIAAITKANETHNPEDAKNAYREWMNGTDSEGNVIHDGVRNYRNMLIPAAQEAFQMSFDANTISKDEECANDATVQLVNAITLKAIGDGKVTAENAPANGINTGIENGVVVSDSQSGITGNLRAIKIVTKDGKVIWILARCGNIVTKKEVFHHHGKTDEHEHHHHPPVCVGSQCLNAKTGAYQSLGSDNTRGSGSGTKPKEKVKTPVESTPPPVNTSQTGGGGVTDTSTNKPGSETGVKAPGASPAPTTSSTPKPNEGGTNNGVVTD